jgi:PAS domain S-box-containing protein
MELRALVESTGDPAFASNAGGRIVAWNAAAERLMGHAAGSVLGRPCHAVVCGTDFSGNAFCRKDCALLEMIRCDRPIHTFALRLRSASGETIPVACSSLVLFETPSHRRFTVLHHLRPASHWGEVSRLLDSVARRANEGVPLRGGVGRPGASDPAASLTRREVEVLGVLAQGLTTRELAESLCLSVNTVRSHIRNILRKLGVHTQLQAVCLGRHYNLI